jgi:AhpD family alkylhydroperoxidase
MNARISYPEFAPGIVPALLEVGKYVSTTGLDRNLLDLCYMRASQINGCAFCLAMHSTDLLKHGESNVRLQILPAWRETNLFSEQERAALAWTEAVTTLTNRDVPDEVYDEALRVFGEKGLADLTLAVTMINSWNRMNVAFRNQPIHGL